MVTYWVEEQPHFVHQPLAHCFRPKGYWEPNQTRVWFPDGIRTKTQHCKARSILKNVPEGEGRALYLALPDVDWLRADDE